MKDPYAVLGVDRNASKAEIKKAYRKLSMKHHPDRGGAEAEFKKIKEAYERLTEPEKFRDQHGPGSYYYGGTHADMFEELRRQTASRAGPFGGFNFNLPKQLVIAITLEEAFKGTTINATIPGTTEQPALPVAPGTVHGSKFQGMVTLGDGKQQTVIITVNIKEHPVFKLDGNDLRADRKVPLLSFYTGGSVEVTDLSGSVLSLKIPENFQSGSVLRLKGKGYNANGQRGNMYLTVHAELPKLTEAQIQKLEEILNE